jgi:hypothetical protein
MFHLIQKELNEFVDWRRQLAAGDENRQVKSLRGALSSN